MIRNVLKCGFRLSYLAGVYGKKLWVVQSVSHKASRNVNSIRSDHPQSLMCANDSHDVLWTDWS